MAHQVVWLPAALDDLEAVANYIAADSPTYAAVLVQKMLAAARELADFPVIGRRVPEWNDDLVRERIVYRYRLIYRVEPERVVILAVIHGARLLPEEVRERSG